MENNQFQFHLDQLIKKGLVEKNESKMLKNLITFLDGAAGPTGMYYLDELQETPPVDNSEGIHIIAMFF